MNNKNHICKTKEAPVEVASRKTFLSPSPNHLLILNYPFNISFCHYFLLLSVSCVSFSLLHVLSFPVYSLSQSSVSGLRDVFKFDRDGYSLDQAQVVGIVGIVWMVGMVGIVGINK